MADFSISTHDSLPADECRLVDSGLGESNDTAAPLHEVQPLSCFARDGAGRVVGGAVGRWWGACCELQQLWVEPALRGQGIGSALVEAFEARAREHGCRSFYLETFSFQAPALYRSLGYAVAHELKAFPHGIAKCLMVKEAAPTPAFPSLPLRTGRLLLRPMRRADAPALFGMLSDPVVMRYWSSAPWTHIDQAHASIERDAKWLASGEVLRLGIERVEDGQLLGQCSLFDISRSCRRASVGYVLGTAAWGQGYMGEALRALLGYAFDTLDLHRIEADIDPRNLASAKTLERQGFRKEGHLRERWIVEGEVSDSALYGLLRPDWSHTAAP